VGCYVWYGEEGPGRAAALLAVPNATAHPSMASVPITVLLYNGQLLGGFNVPIKGLNYSAVCEASDLRTSQCDYARNGAR